MPITQRMFAWGSLLAVLLTGCGGSNDVEVGSIKVLVSTTGAAPDADGYTVVIGQQSGEPIAADGNLTVGELLPGDYPVRVTGLAANCYVVGTNPLTARVVAGGQATVSFDVSCPGTGTRVKVTMIATGADLDPDGYLLKIGEATRRVPTQGVTNLSIDGEGELAVEITDLAPNCTADPANPATVTTALSVETPLTLKVVCAAITGTIKVTVTTSGNDVPTGPFRIRVGANLKSTDALNTASFARLTAGTHDVVLDNSNIPGNCLVGGTSTQSVVVTVGAVTELTFLVTCTGLAHVVTNVSTTGQDIDANGYTIELQSGDYYYPGPYYRFDVPGNGTAQSPGILPGSYSVGVSGIASNCRLTSPVTNSIIMGTVDVALNLSLQCDRAREIAFVVGAGSATEIAIGFETSIGDFTVLTSNAVADSNPAWSPNGTRLAFASARDGNSEIYLMNADGTGAQRLTTNVAADYQPTWSPDGNRIAFVSARDGNPEIYVMGADGSNAVRLTNSSSVDAEPAWSPDGSRILFVSNRSLSVPYIHVMNADGSGVSRVTSLTLAEASPAWSRTGGQIAFGQAMTGAPGQNRLLVVNADGSQVVDQYWWTRGPTSLAWGPDERIAFSGTRCDPFSCDSFALKIRKVDGSLVDLPWSFSSEPAWRP